VHSRRKIIIFSSINIFFWLPSRWEMRRAALKNDFYDEFSSRDENFKIIRFSVSSFFKFISIRLWVVLNCSTLKVSSKFSGLDIQRGFTFHVSFICSRCRYLSRKFIFFLIRLNMEIAAKQASPRSANWIWIGERRLWIFN
jgi:hypothetical protein